MSGFSLRSLFSVFICLLSSQVFALKAYVSANKDNAVNVIDLKTNKVIATIPDLAQPDNLTISPDGRFVYVANSGAATISVIETDKDKVVATIEVGKDPEGLVLDQDGKLMLAAAQDANALLYVDPINYTVLNKITLPSIYSMALNKTNTLLYAGSQEPGKAALKIVDVAKKTLTHNIPLANAPMGLQFGPGDHYLYYTAAGIDAILVFDPIKRQVVKQIATAPLTRALEFTHDGRWGLATNQSANLLYVFDPEDNVIIDRIPVGKMPNGIAVSLNDKFAYVVNEGADSVSVVDLVNKKVVGTIEVGKAPRNIVVQGMIGEKKPQPEVSEVKIKIPGI